MTRHSRSGHRRRDRAGIGAEGGAATRRSYQYRDARDLPDVHRLRGSVLLPLCYDDRDRFVHAGIHPGQAARGRSDDDLIWIREPFFRTRVITAA